MVEKRPVVSFDGNTLLLKKIANNPDTITPRAAKALNWFKMREFT